MRSVVRTDHEMEDPSFMKKHINSDWTIVTRPGALDAPGRPAFQSPFHSVITLGSCRVMVRAGARDPF
jgi:hypothetical protein